MTSYISYKILINCSSSQESTLKKTRSRQTFIALAPKTTPTTSIAKNQNHSTEIRIRFPPASSDPGASALKVTLTLATGAAEELLRHIEVGSEILLSPGACLTDDEHVRQKLDSGAILVHGREELPYESDDNDVLFARHFLGGDDSDKDDKGDKVKEDKGRRDRNANARLSRSQSCRVGNKGSATLPRRRRRRAFSGSLAGITPLPPHRVTPDGTAIYYWCELPRRPGSQGNFSPKAISLGGVDSSRGGGRGMIAVYGVVLDCWNLRVFGVGIERSAVTDLEETYETARNRGKSEGIFFQDLSKSYEIFLDLTGRCN